MPSLTPFAAGLTLHLQQLGDFVGQEFRWPFQSSANRVQGARAEEGVYCLPDEEHGKGEAVPVFPDKVRSAANAIL